MQAGAPFTMHTATLLAWGLLRLPLRWPCTHGLEKLRLETFLHACTHTEIERTCSFICDLALVPPYAYVLHSKDTTCSVDTTLDLTPGSTPPEATAL